VVCAAWALAVGGLGAIAKALEDGVLVDIGKVLYPCAMTIEL
jgi:hypothetical protein